jgi:hypothetical protein
MLTMIFMRSTFSVERSPRDAEPAAIFRDRDALAARQQCAEPDDSDEFERDAAALHVRVRAAVARLGFRRERVESGACNSVGHLHRVTDSVGVPPPAESLCHSHVARSKIIGLEDACDKRRTYRRLRIVAAARAHPLAGIDVTSGSTVYCGGAKLIRAL